MVGVGTTYDCVDMAKVCVQCSVESDSAGDSQSRWGRRREGCKWVGG